MRLRDIFKSKAFKNTVLAVATGAALVSGMAGSAEAGGRRRQSAYDRAFDQSMDRARRDAGRRAGEALGRLFYGDPRAAQRHRQEEQREQREMEQAARRRQQESAKILQTAQRAFNDCVKDKSTGPLTQQKLDLCKEVAATTAQMGTGFIPSARPPVR